MQRIYLLLIIFFTGLNALAQEKSISGFSPAAAMQEKTLEQKFDAQISSENIGKLIKDLSARPHHVGSPGGKAVSEYISNLLKSCGYQVTIEHYYVPFPTPMTRVLEMTSPTVYRATLAEPALAADATSGQTDEQLPTYNCWSADGDVTAPIVFVNFGLPEDYDLLHRMGIDVSGKIVLAKYGHSWRGIKPKLAQEHGAIGCIIYSDPHEDGYFAGETYPDGPFKNEYGVQRGSVMDMPIYPGDPLTPNMPALKDAKRLDRKDAVTLLKIPVLPISYHDALPLLKSLEGPVAPASWRGALPITYHIGPGKTTVHLKLAFNWDLKELNNIIAVLPGSLKDELVVRGNHHDAWVNGANDPISGQAAMLEEARAIGSLVKSGWHPLRTLVYCAWDAEEPALLGSTEWVEQYEKKLQKDAVVYINTDGNGRGFLEAGGSHALETVMNEVARDVIDPETNISVLERRMARDMVEAATTTEKQQLMSRKSLPLDALGSGSDYSPFIHHIGIPSLNIGYGGEDEGGEYHSIYDSYDNYRRFKDPGFVYGAVLAKTTGRFVLRMSEAKQLPFDFTILAKTVSSYTSELISLLEQKRTSTNVENELINSGKYKYANNPTQPINPPSIHAEVPYLNFAPLQNATDSLKKVAAMLQDTLSKTRDLSKSFSELDHALASAEQKLLSEKGLPGRPWYRHVLYAPGLYTGYGVKTLPGIREAIEQRNWTQAQEQIDEAAKVITQFAANLKNIIPLVK